MILGVGTDMVNVTRIKLLIERFGQRFSEKFFTGKENSQALNIEDRDKKIAFYAKRFAAKEAFAKACGIGIGRGINFCDIEVSNNELGKPEIDLVNAKNSFLSNIFASQKLSYHLSLSDEKGFAQAFVVIEKIK